MNIGIVTSLLMPADAIHCKAVSIVLPGALLNEATSGLGVGLTSSAVPSTWMMLYAVAYPIVAVWLATRVFGKRDL